MLKGKEKKQKIKNRTQFSLIPKELECITEEFFWELRLSEVARAIETHTANTLLKQLEWVTRESHIRAKIKHTAQAVETESITRASGIFEGKYAAEAMWKSYSREELEGGERTICSSGLTESVARPSGRLR